MRVSFGLFWLVLGMGLTSCDPNPPNFYSGAGKRPVYATADELNDIRSLPPQEIEESGTIFLLDTLFFMQEQGKGVHVFNVSDPENPVSIVFFKIPAISGFTISNNRLFANAWRDLVTVDITDLLNIRLLDRQTGAFEPLLYPPLYRGNFECVDETRGAVLYWEDAQLENAACRTI